MKVSINKNGNAKELTKVKDLLTMLEGVFPNQITQREVLEIETSNKIIYQLLNSITKDTNAEMFECPRCHKMVNLITKKGICRPCLMNDANTNARKKRDAEFASIDNPIMASKIG
jgi:hypothetical protein